jgi:2'-5' RNA ligase
MRLFIALDIPAEVRSRLTGYVERVRPLAPDARWARIESLHVTLKFIGEVADAKVSEIKSALVPIKVEPFRVDFKEIGFFPNPRSPRIFWAGVNASDALPQLAATVESAMERIGIDPEKRPYHPHLTLARAPEGGASRNCFRLLQERLATEASADFGTMTAVEFFLYQSQLMRGGSRYTKLQRFSLQ